MEIIALDVYPVVNAYSVLLTHIMMVMAIVKNVQTTVENVILLILQSAQIAQEGWTLWIINANLFVQKIACYVIIKVFAKNLHKDMP